MAEAALFLALVAAAAAIAITLALPEGMILPAPQLRAKRLFMSLLGEAERRSWAKHRRLTVIGSSGGCYTLMPYAAFNIQDGKDEYCLRVVGRIPPYDKLLAQRLLLESDEETFLQIANRRELRRL